MKLGHIGIITHRHGADKTRSRLARHRLFDRKWPVTAAVSAPTVRAVAASHSDSVPLDGFPRGLAERLGCYVYELGRPAFSRSCGPGAWIG